MAAKRKIVCVNARNYRIGEDHGRAKLTNEQVDEMRDLREESGWSLLALSQRFGVSVSTVWAICNYRTRAQTPHAYRTLRPDSI